MARISATSNRRATFCDNVAKAKSPRMVNESPKPDKVAVANIGTWRRIAPTGLDKVADHTPSKVASEATDTAGNVEPEVNLFRTTNATKRIIGPPLSPIDTPATKESEGNVCRATLYTSGKKRGN